MIKFVSIAVATAFIATPVTFADERFEFDFEFNRNEVKTTEGAEKVYDRLMAQIQDVCEVGGRKSVERMQMERECKDVTADTAIAQIDSETVKDIHEKKS